MFDQDTVLRLGDYCERLLGDDDFNTISQMFEAHTLQQLMSTKREDKEAREQLFATIQSVREYLNFMVELAKQKQQLENPTPVDHSDDPSVHDIYSED